MKILMVFSTPFPPEEGIGNYVFGLSKELSIEGHEVTLVTRGLRGTNQRIISDGVEIVSLPFYPIYPLHVHLHGLFLQRFLDRMKPKPDIIHIHSPLSPIVRSDVPIIATIHTPILIDVGHYENVGLLSLLSRAQSMVSHQLELGLLKRCKLVTVVSGSVASELGDYDFDEKEIVVIGNGVDGRTFRPVESEKKGRAYVLFVGRLDPRKGLFDLIECIRIFTSYRKDIDFVVVGKGSLEQRLKERVKELGLSNYVRFLGFVSKERLLRLYGGAEAFVLPSWYEGLPTVLLEAMACGLPVVGTSVSGTLDVINPGHNGILVNPKSPEGLAKALLDLVGDEKLRDHMGKAARATIEDSFTWETIANRVLECYCSIK